MRRSEAGFRDGGVGGGQGWGLRQLGHVCLVTFLLFDMLLSDFLLFFAERERERERENSTHTDFVIRML